MLQPPTRARSAAPRRDGAGGLRDMRGRRAGFSAGDGIEGPLGIVDDGDVAGEHIGKVFEEPEGVRKALLHAGGFGGVGGAAPAFETHGVVGIANFDGGRG